MTAQLTASEIFDLIHANKWDLEYFMPLQNEVTARINAKLRGEEIKFLDDHELFIYRRVEDKILGDQRELEQTVKYAGVEPHVSQTMEIGAILVSSWGYEQTNVDFYVVVEMTAKMVKLLPLKKRSRQSNYSDMAGTTTAAQEANFREVVLSKKIQPGNSVKIESYSRASLWDGRKQYESWYA